MNSLPSSLRDSVFSILGIENITHSKESVADIRLAMLQVLRESQTPHPELRNRLQRTQDATGLWFARAELYAHLCRTQCEPVALERVRSLTPLFVGCIPAGLMGTRNVGEPPKGRVQ